MILSNKNIMLRLSSDCSCASVDSWIKLHRTLKMASRWSDFNYVTISCFHVLIQTISTYTHFWKKKHILKLPFNSLYVSAWMCWRKNKRFCLKKKCQCIDFIAGGQMLINCVTKGLMWLAYKFIYHFILLSTAST